MEEMTTSDTPEPNMMAMAVTLGEIKTEVKRLVGMEERLRTVEITLNSLETKQALNTRPRAPWYAVTGAIVGIVTGVATLVTFVIIMANVLSRLEGL